MSFPRRPFAHAQQAASPSRRTFVQGLFLGGVAASTGLLRIPEARARDSGHATPGTQLAGSDLQLDIGASTVNFTGRVRPAITVNNSR